MQLPDLALAADANGADAVEALLRVGWSEVGRGDWSWVFASPDGRIAARVTPWDPAYRAFVDLCGTMPNNCFLPRMYRVDPLREVGHIAWMQRLWPAPEAAARSFCLAIGIPSDSHPEWLSDEAHPWHGDADQRAALVQLRERVRVLFERCAASLPCWGGSDISPKNVLQDAGGQLKLVDPGYVAGRRIVQAIVELDAKALGGYSRAELQGFLQIPVFEPGPELEALKQCVWRVAGA